jgi:hypothetical protein
MRYEALFECEQRQRTKESVRLPVKGDSSPIINFRLAVENQWASNHSMWSSITFRKTS